MIAYIFNSWLQFFASLLLYLRGIRNFCGSISIHFNWFLVWLTWNILDYFILTDAFLFEVKNSLVIISNEHRCRFSASQEPVPKVLPSDSTLSNMRRIHQKLGEILKMHSLPLYYPTSHLFSIGTCPCLQFLRLIFMDLFAGSSCSGAF